MKDLILVDDDTINNLMNKRLIEKSFDDINVITFTSGKDLIEYIFSEGKHIGKAFARPIHILIDLAMPSLSGIETLMAIKQRDSSLFRELRISVLSGHVSLSKELSSNNLSMINFIQKPLKLDILNRVLEKK